MCETCGCQSNLFNEEEHSHDHEHKHGGHEHERVPTMNPLLDDRKSVAIIKNILNKNEEEALHIRGHFDKKKVFALNLMSSPGSGKTSLLEKTAELVELKIAVLEGDLETNKDADRIRAKGVPAYQITTGQSCHLDAFMVHHGLHHLEKENYAILFVENVGNLVCPATYDIGTHRNIVLLSVPEGDDKVAKYPVMFRKADLVLVTKWDLREHFDFSIEAVEEDVKKLNSGAEIIPVSIKDNESIMKWIDYIKRERVKKFP